MRQTKNYGWDVVQRSDGRPDIEQVTNVFDSIDEKVKQLDDKDTFIENRIDETNESVTQTNQKVTELTGTVTQTNNTVTQINTKVQGLETKTEQINTKIVQIETEATSLGERVSQTETEITTLDGRVSGLENATIEIATVEEAIAGERNDIAMSPYTTKQAHYAWGGGGRGNVFIRSKSTNSFTASTETTTFTISDFKDTYMIELIFKNLSPVEEVDYRLNRLTGEVTLLTFSLKTGDTIYYNIFDTKAQVFKSGQKQGEFVAGEETGTFTIPDFNNEKQATLIFDGLVLLENNEYTITNQGVVTLLNWTLKIGEKITYLIETTSYDYNELSNKPVIPTVDVDKAYVDNKIGDTTALQTTNKANLVSAINELKKDKIDKSQIKNNLTETNAGNVLDATQGKVLNDKISDLTRQQNIKHYYSLAQIGLEDSQFAGLTQTQAFDLLVNTMRRYSILQIRCDSSVSNFREAIYQYSNRTNSGKGVIALLEVNVYGNERYDARISGENLPTFLFECAGYPTVTSDWQQIATTNKLYTDSSIPEIIVSEANLNTYNTLSNSLPNKTYYRKTMGNNVVVPEIGGGIWYLEGFKINESYEWQLIRSYHEGYLKHRYKSNGVWSSFNKMATTAKTEILLPYNEGWSDVDDYFKSSAVRTDTTATLYLNSKSSNPITNREIVCILPVGYRPKLPISLMTGHSTSQAYDAVLSIYPNGNVMVRPANGTAQTNFYGTFTYIIGG